MRLELCESVCEADKTGAGALTTNCMSNNTNGPTQHTDFSHVKTKSSKCETKFQEQILNLNPPSNTHISSESVKLANGKNGLISGYFSNVVRHSGVNLESENSDNASNLI